MVNVVKATGEIEKFSEEKLLQSAKRAGIPDDLQNQALSYVKDRLYENIPTHEVYYRIQEFLDKTDKPFFKAKYSLKSSLMDLGPTGFPFEDYVSEILKKEGFKTKIGEVLMGKCVTHEVDISAENIEDKFMIECKFHNRPGSRSDVQVALYTKARFDDLKIKQNFTKAMLVTNTKVTQDALAYAECENIEVLSWEYPERRSLRELIEKHKLYPITQLTFLNQSQKQELMTKGIVLIKQLCENPSVLENISIPRNHRESALEEAKNVCQI